MSMHLGISILDEGRSQVPSTASLPSVWTELTPGAAGAPGRVTCTCSAACAWGPEPERGGGEEDQPGGQLLTAAETTVVTGHHDSNAWRMGGPGNWEAVSLWRRWLWTVWVLGLRVSQRGAQPPPAPRHSRLYQSSGHWHCGVSVFGKAPAFSCHLCCWGTCFGPLCLSFLYKLKCFFSETSRKENPGNEPVLQLSWGKQNQVGKVQKSSQENEWAGHWGRGSGEVQGSESPPRAQGAHHRLSCTSHCKPGFKQGGLWEMLLI